MTCNFKHLYSLLISFIKIRQMERLLLKLCVCFVLMYLFYPYFLTEYKKCYL